MTNNTLRMQRRFSVSCLFVFTFVQCLSASASSWVHEVSDASSPRASQLRIRTVAQEDDHLVGSATYNEVGHDVTLEIKGVQTPDGRFWPNAALEAADNWNGPWRQVDQVKISGQPITLSFRFAEANAFLYVSFDALRPLIGKMRYGRIVLPNGDETLFELRELLPGKTTGVPIEDDWQLNIPMGYLSNSIAEGPFFVGGIAFNDGHLRAEAGYLDPEATAATIIDGSKTSKESSTEDDFWASATLQIANDPRGEWQTVGQAATPGKSATLVIQPKEKSIKNLNIGVDILRPMIGKFGYGRAVLKNGKVAAFELLNLLPPRDRR